MLAGLLVLLAVASVRDRFNDPDLWWHLKTGDVIWTTHTVPTTDLFSWTTGHHAWIPHEWLSQTLIYTAYRWGGYSGLMLWLCCFTACLLVGGYVLCSLYSGNSKTAFAGALVIWLFATIGFSIRPQLIGYNLLVVELLLVHLGRTRSPRWFYWLPPLFALWINCHGSFFLGLVLLGLFIFCSFFHFQAGLLTAPQWDHVRRRALMLAAFLSVAVTLLNPGGLKQVLYPVDTMLHQPINLAQVQEWKPLEWNDPRGVGLLVVLGCIFLLLILRRSEIFFHELLLLALGTWLAITHGRMLFVFGILAAPVLSRLIAGEWEDYDANRDLPWANATMLALSLLTAMLAFPSRASLSRQVAAGNPTKAVEFIRTHHISGPMLNAYAYGGYLIWALPEQPVFIDGRADLYEWAGVLAKVSSWANLESDPNELLDQYRVNFCFLERNSRMATVLPLLHGWRLAYSDDTSVIYVRMAVGAP